MREPVKYIIDKVSIFIYCKFEDMYNITEKKTDMGESTFKSKVKISKEKQKEWFWFFYNELESWIVMLTIYKLPIQAKW